MAARRAMAKPSFANPTTKWRDATLLERPRQTPFSHLIVTTTCCCIQVFWLAFAGWGSAVEASYWRIKFYANWLAGFVGAVLAAFAGFELIERFVHGQDARSIAANIYIVVLSTGMLIFVAIRQWTTIRKERYANIAPTLHQLMHQIRDVNTFIRTREPTGGIPQEYQRFADDCKMFFGRILDQLNSIFVSITSTHCRPLSRWCTVQGRYTFTHWREIKGLVRNACNSTSGAWIRTMIRSAKISSSPSYSTQATNHGITSAMI